MFIIQSTTTTSATTMKGSLLNYFYGNTARRPADQQVRNQGTTLKTSRSGALRMAKKKNRKRSRSSSRDHDAGGGPGPGPAPSPSSSWSSSPSTCKCDLFVAMPPRQSTKALPVTSLLVKQLLDRLEATGFTHVALTHIVFGTPQADQDCAETAIPSSLWKTATTSSTKNSNNNDSKPTNKIHVLRRLHAIVENAADVGFYAARKDQNVVLRDYDIISVSPRNDAALVAACTSATACEIITLDYSNMFGSRSGSGGKGLPFRIRAPAVKAAIERMVRFEILYAPAILHANQRRYIIQTSREFQMACRSLSRNEKQRSVIFSSGDRRRLLKVAVGDGNKSSVGSNSANNTNNNDVGALALRTYGDLRNLFATVLGFDDNVAASALSTAALGAIQQGHVRRFGGVNAMACTAIGSVAVEPGDCRLLEFIPRTNKTTKSATAAKPPPASSMTAGPASSRKDPEPRRPAPMKRKAYASDQDTEMDDEEEEKIQDGFISF
jgi:RNase P subunit p30